MDAARMLGTPKEPLPVTVDTREQRPLGMPPDYATCTPGALPVGDYALTGDGWYVERKSVDDLIASIINGHLADQLRRMREQHGDRLSVLVVDGDKDEFAAWPWGARTNRATCAWAFSELYRMAYEYGVCIDWNPSRRWAALSVWRWLRTRAKVS
jgi:ERCC4-type nuclease